jgi:DNA-binding CsgD family transcriptional regulator
VRGATIRNVTVGRLADTVQTGFEASILEREREVAEIDRALATTLAGNGRVLLVEGPAGIGKSTLLRVSSALARDRGVTVLSGRGSPLERQFSYGVVRQLYEPYGLADATNRLDVLEGAAGLSVRAFREGDGEPAGGDVSFATLHGLYWLTANLASRAPIALVVDDSHWADVPSLRFLLHLGSRLEGLRALVLVARRTGYPGAVPELERELAVIAGEALRPGQLGPASTARLVQSELGSRASQRFCGACHEATDGNPLLVRTLIASVAAEGIEPTDEAAAQVDSFGLDGVRRFLDRQLAHFPDEAAAFVEALAVLGDGAPLRQVARLADLDLGEASAYADSLRHASILSSDEELRFEHPILSGAVLERMGRGERAIAHARAAGILAAEGEPADRLALHLLHTHRVGSDATTATLREAAVLAAERGAPDTAASYLERSLEEPPPQELRAPLELELGLAQLAARRDVEATRLLVRAVTALKPSDQASGALAAGRALGMIGRFEEAATVLELALPQHSPRSETELLVEAEFLANAWLLGDRLPVAVRRLARYREADAPAGIGRQLMAVHRVALQMRTAAPSAAAWALLDNVMENGAVLREHSLVLSWVLMPLVFTDRLGEIEAICSELMQLGEQRGSAYLVAHLAFPRAFAALRLGRLREAEDYGRWSLTQKLARGMTDGRPWHGVALIDALIERGDLQAAEVALARLDAPESPPEQLAWALLLETRGRLRVAQMRSEEALADLLEAGGRFERLQWNHPGITVWRCDAARTLSLLGESGEAMRLAAEHLDLARATQLPRPTGIAALGLAAVSPRQQAMPLFQEAIECLEGTPARLELAKALVECGAALRRSGKRLEARSHLRRGLELAHRAGARPLATRAREELVAAGGRPRKPVFTGIDALTASELRVAAMAATGATNRDIAQRLFVTQKTIETHLRHVFEKLDIRRREDLPNELVPSGGVADVQA